MITSDQKQTLIFEACKCRQNAYAPYSNYKVGAALLTANGNIITGINVENASYGLSNCAERTAVFKMVASGEQSILAIAVCTENSGSPCGACRQVLIEFASDIPVYLCDPHGNTRETSLHKLLPDHFGPEHLT
ncbi:MAG: cytidine deaminase [Methylococcales bacterium]|nr:cytidine deaminase [Methylococcales bacterium]